MSDDSEERDRKLTPKQEAFARAYVELRCGADAYRRSYDASGSTAKSVHEEASKLLAKPKIATRVAELTQQAAERTAVTIEELTNMLRDDRELARVTKDPVAAVNAVLAIAKLHGLIVDKKLVKSDNRHHHTAEPLSPFAEHLEGVLGAGAEGAPPRSLQN